MGQKENEPQQKPRWETVEDEPGMGYFQMELRLAAGDNEALIIFKLPAIPDIQDRQNFKENQINQKQPVIAYRCGERGMVHVSVHPGAEVTEVVRHFLSWDSRTLNSQTVPKEKQENLRWVDSGGNSPNNAPRLEIEGGLDRMKFQAVISFVPEGYKMDHRFARPLAAIDSV